MIAVSVFPQNEIVQRGSIPEELLRPRRDEAPRYPIDTIIGALGQGQATPEAYEIARKTAAALLAGSIDVPVLSSVNKVFLEDCISKLNGINPRSFRLGSGREEPDGSFSFLVRFIGREEGITGELFVRLEERRPKIKPPPPVKETDLESPDGQSENAESPDVQSADFESADVQTADVPSVDIPSADSQPAGFQPADVQAPDVQSADSAEFADVESNENIATAQAVEPPVDIPVEKVWIFEDLILEEPRSRETENRENRHRFDFSPYERFF